MQLDVPQHERLRTRLRHAAAQGEIRSGADIGAIADALIGTLLLHALSASGNRRAAAGFDGLLDALLDGALVHPTQQPGPAVLSGTATTSAVGGGDGQ
ncbi:hypothetical protein AB0M34_27980 [Nocardia sp. NPDC050193]